ncbi:DDE-type integrase/transposase/recombinase [Stenotrophomonas sp. PD6]|uniref:DDE-type integrase/transposase/recombinase n=1 Tax=Stenotrophomonas sp. PD6 TaxID=3368612 RepID=UPI003B9FD47B
MYLAAVISLQTRHVLRYSLSDRMPDDLVQQAFLNARAASLGQPGLLFHPARGSQYINGAFGGTVTTHGVLPSMIRKGNCWGNVVTERFFCHLEERRSHRPI